MAFEQFLANIFNPQNMAAFGNATGPSTGATVAPPTAPMKPAMSAADGGAASGGAPDLNAFLTMLMQSLSQPAPGGGGMGDLAALAKVLRPDPLGEVARSNSRPGGFTPQAEWDAWGPSARKPQPVSDARNALRFGGGENPMLAQPNMSQLAAANASVTPEQPPYAPPAGPTVASTGQPFDWAQLFAR